MKAPCHWQWQGNSPFQERYHPLPHDYWTPGAQSFRTETKLETGEPVLMIDPGSIGNLAGDRWSLYVSAHALHSGRTTEQTQRPRPLQVCGVGHGSQTCDFDRSLPVAFKQTNGTHTEGTLTFPVVQDSDLPGVFGLRAMQERRTILDMHTLKIHFLGPGNYNLNPSLPAGTESYQCELSPSGHIVLPCSRYSGIDRENEGPIGLVPTTWPEVSRSLDVNMTTDRKQKLDEAWKRVQELKEREQAPPPVDIPVETSPLVNDYSSSDGPPGLLDDPNHLVPRLSPSDSSSQDRE
jgi:hypothetical protein